MIAVQHNALFLAWFAVLGAAVGSFLNVVIYRLPRGFRVNLPSRSACVKCKRRLSWYENVPILAWLALRGRCRGCRTPIAFRYPLVEALCSALFVAVYGYFGLSFAAFYYCVFAAALLAVTFIDLDHRIIPDEISLPGIALGILGSTAVPGLGWQSSALAAASGGGFFWLTAWLYEKWSGREGLGFGDVKLLAMIGAFLGPWGVLGTVLLSSVLGSIVGLSVIVFKGGNLKFAVPYGPFLAIGALAHLFWGGFVLGQA